MEGLTAYALSKKYASRIGSTINGTSYDYDTGKITFNTNDGDWEVTVNNGMNASYKQTLDNISYNNTDGKLEINGIPVLTEEDEADEDIDFGNMFN